VRILEYGDLTAEHLVLMEIRSLSTWPMPVLQVAVVVDLAVDKVVMLGDTNREEDLAMVDFPEEDMVEAMKYADT
jgi:hypothetical protein